jgi:hypothetical protein
MRSKGAQKTRRVMAKQSRAVSKLRREQDQLLAQQAATAEILGAIKSSPTDSGPVFQAIANSAARLCNALNSSVYRFDGNLQDWRHRCHSRWPRLHATE